MPRIYHKCGSVNVRVSECRRSGDGRGFTPPGHFSLLRGVDATWPDQPVSPPDAIRSGCRFGWNGQPTAFHTGDCRPAARSLTVRGQAVIKCHLDTRPPDDSPPDPCTTDGLPRPSPSSLRQYDPSFSQDIQPGLHLQLWSTAGDQD
ncbi:hypothetical protein PGTUg99_014999 [Puccinia graminis f. sp. tritici]|uniref:Uncharacterized protein n=1 Tax=Puccinia graminis f. sp. tritici TaxID=56615 RepID=A0A5B0RMB6_PUCGR|nr:hypothetical protein PGTUg99_014999 [Puccinia graminis f. sp. tritici]